MSSTYSRNSWPYKNIVISFFSTVLEVFAGCWGLRRRGGGMVGPGVSVRGRAERGWTEDGKPHSDRLSLSVPVLQWQRAVLSGCWGFWSSQRLPPGPSLSPRCSPSWLAVEQRVTGGGSFKPKMTMFKSCETLYRLNMKVLSCSFSYFVSLWLPHPLSTVTWPWFAHLQHSVVLEAKALF